MSRPRFAHAISPAYGVIVVSALVGGLFARSALAVDDKMTERYATFSAALSAIESQYVDKVAQAALLAGKTISV